MHTLHRISRRLKGSKSSLLPLAAVWMGMLGMALWHTASLFAASSNVNVQVCSPHDDVTIVTPTDGTTTRDSSIVVSGYGNADVSVVVYRNNGKTGEVTSGGDGSYSISVPLEFGDNSILARTTNPCGQNTDSNTATVHRPAPPGRLRELAAPSSAAAAPETAGPTAVRSPADTPPVVEGSKPVISEPPDGLVTASPTIVVRGRAMPGVPVDILRNDQKIAQVMADDQGVFSVSVPLLAGQNTIVVSYMGASAVITSEPVTVIYQPSSATPAQTEPKTPLIPALIMATSILALITGVLLWHHFRRPGIKLPPARWHIGDS